MGLSDKDILLLRELLLFLRKSFRGASFGDSKIDDMAAALERAIPEETPT